ATKVPIATSAPQAGTSSEMKASDSMKASANTIGAAQAAWARTNSTIGCTYSSNISGSGGGRCRTALPEQAGADLGAALRQRDGPLVARRAIWQTLLTVAGQRSPQRVHAERIGRHDLVGHRGGRVVLHDRGLGVIRRDCRGRCMRQIENDDHGRKNNGSQ